LVLIAAKLVAHLEPFVLLEELVIRFALMQAIVQDNAKTIVLFLMLMVLFVLRVLVELVLGTSKEACALETALHVVKVKSALMHLTANISSVIVTLVSLETQIHLLVFKMV